MGQVLSLPFKLLGTTKTYIFGFFHYWCGKGRHAPFSKTESTFKPLHPLPTDTEEQKLFKQHARIHLYTLAANFYLYPKPHYRKGTYADDLTDNLRNVAIPGTGLPLSLVAASRVAALPFLLCTYPLVSLAAALHHWLLTTTKSTSTTKVVSISKEYATRLLAPDDWFSYWRLNCVVTGLHALLNDMPVDYEMENKWTFLEKGVARDVPVSPFLTTPAAIVVKHRNEEGGLGIFFYKNAAAGGDWIIQERIDNSAWVSALLPPNAPLSTFRVITCSRASITMEQPVMQSQQQDPSTKQVVTALSCVFRAGRAGAATDHDSILFDVDVATGKIKGGTTNAHWYRLWGKAWNTPWRSHHSTTHHPDVVVGEGGGAVTGNVVPDLDRMLQLATESHFKLCPRVPFCGWDVVLSSNPAVPICLLEVNLSCNFFRGSFDKKVRVSAPVCVCVSAQYIMLLLWVVPCVRDHCASVVVHTKIAAKFSVFPLIFRPRRRYRCIWTLSTTPWSRCRRSVSWPIERARNSR